MYNVACLSVDGKVALSPPGRHNLLVGSLDGLFVALRSSLMPGLNEKRRSDWEPWNNRKVYIAPIPFRALQIAEERRRRAPSKQSLHIRLDSWEFLSTGGPHVYMYI